MNNASEITLSVINNLHVLVLPPCHDTHMHTYMCTYTPRYSTNVCHSLCFSELSASPSSAKGTKSPASMPPPMVTPTRLQTLRNQTLKLHLPGSGRNYISLGTLPVSVCLQYILHVLWLHVLCFKSGRDFAVRCVLWAYIGMWCIIKT